MLFEILGVSSIFNNVLVPSPLSTSRNLVFALNALGNIIKIAKRKATFIMHLQMPFAAIFKRLKPRL